jgi:hypothetical protein
MTEQPSQTGVWVLMSYRRVNSCPETDKARDPPPPTSEYPRRNCGGLARLVAFK